MSIIDSWISNFPELQKGAIREAVVTARLAKVRRALRLIGDLGSEERGPVFRLELLGTYNLEPVLPFLQFALSCVPAQAHLHLGPLNDIEGYISRPAYAAGEELPDARVVLWRVEELLPELFFPISNGFPEQLASLVTEVINRAERIVHLHQRQAKGVPLFLSTLAMPPDFANPVFGAQHPAGLPGSVGRINQKMFELATNYNGVFVLDLASWAAGGGRSYTDTMLDFVARQPMSNEGQMSFALFLARVFRSLLVPRRKVLALDLDNTLWGGVVGEDGIRGLKLGQEFPGNVHLRIQRELLELRNRGILLVLLSKNNEADVREAFESLPMALKWDDFVLRRINWSHKHENLRDAARELRLGLDSFVFLDDSDYEREQIRQLLPEVQVLNNSADPLRILQSLWETDAFDSFGVTAEDRGRASDYAARGGREVHGHEDELESFLKSLQMEAEIEDVGAENLDRIVAMLGKTNQFNLTTRRHTRAQVEMMVEKKEAIALALRLRDRFGEQGIVALLLANRSDDGSALAIDSFLVSCRALGRGVEDALWAELVKRAQEQQVSRIKGDYVRTAKNEIVARFYDGKGLERIGEEGAITSYKLEPINSAPFPAWIELRSQTYA